MLGFSCHWQRTAHSLLPALVAVKAWNPEAVTFCGGFTASYFAEDFLVTTSDLESVIVGDPEELVKQLLQG